MLDALKLLKNSCFLEFRTLAEAVLLVLENLYNSVVFSEQLITYGIYMWQVGVLLIIITIIIYDLGENFFH